MFITVKQITGTFAMWAIRQSPYSLPYGLGSAVLHLEKELKIRLKDYLQVRDEWISCNRDILESTIKEIILDSEFIEARMWDKSAIKFYHRPQCDELEFDEMDLLKDQESMDIRALVANVLRSVFQEE